jgi:hypothetical protein
MKKKIIGLAMIAVLSIIVSILFLGLYQKDFDIFNKTKKVEISPTK